MKLRRLSEVLCTGLVFFSDRLLGAFLLQPEGNVYPCSLSHPQVDITASYRILFSQKSGYGASLLSLMAACLRARAGKLEALERGLAPGRRDNFEFSVGDPQKELPIIGRLGSAVGLLPAILCPH